MHDPLTTSVGLMIPGSAKLFLAERLTATPASARLKSQHQQGIQSPNPVDFWDTQQ